LRGRTRQVRGGGALLRLGRVPGTGFTENVVSYGGG